MPYLVFEPNCHGFPKGFIQYEKKIFKTNVVKSEKHFNTIFDKLEDPKLFMENYAIRDILEYEACDFLVSYEEDLYYGENFQELLAMDNLLESIHKK